MLARLPRREWAFYEDEVDIHLNPKVGLDWMVCGQQKEVATPGKNEKRYLAGALEVRTRMLIWVEGTLPGVISGGSSESGGCRGGSRD